MKIESFVHVEKMKKLLLLFKTERNEKYGLSFLMLELENSLFRIKYATRSNKILDEQCLLWLALDHSFRQ